MSLTLFLGTRYANLLGKIAWLIALLVALQIGLLAYTYFLLLKSSDGHIDTDIELSSSLAVPANPTISCRDWTMFQKQDTGTGGGITTPGKRFRLAGTFFVHEESSGCPDTRKAVLDDLRDRIQRIVTEDEDMGGITVVRIMGNSVILRGSDGQEEELQMGFSSGAGTQHVIADQAERGVQGAVAAGNRFGGKQLGEYRWVFNRNALLSYYQELRDEPQRLVKVFDSLKPCYDEKRAITGYKLGIDGEAEFFSAVGMKEGDVIRKVNSMPMTNRRRAEAFIGDFVNDRASAFVLEIERDNREQRLVYQIAK